MRTTITIQDELFKDLLRYTHTKKATEAINIIIGEWIRLRKISEIKSLRGSLSIDDNLHEIRKKEIKKIRKLND